MSDGHDAALARLWDVLPQARVVGGAVRDAIAGVPVSDIDLATPLRPDAVVAALAAAGLRAIPTGLTHGTVTALVDGIAFEVTTLRRDVATDGRHATVAFTDDWEADAARRDFTFNAMSRTRDGVVHDYFGGRDDLYAGRVRFVGDPATRIAEDFLRVLRFFRFYARYAAIPPDDATRAALRGGVPGLGGLSPERVWWELRRILAAGAPVKSLRLADELGVLRAVLPEARLYRLAAIERDYPTLTLLRFAALDGADVDATADRLHLANAERETLRAMRLPPPEPTASGLRRALADAPPAVVIGRIALAGLDPALIVTLTATPAPVFPLHGRDLIAAGARPGPTLGAALAQLRQVWLDGGCEADAAILLDVWRRTASADTPVPR